MAFRASWQQRCFAVGIKGREQLGPAKILHSAVDDDDFLG